MLEQRHSKMTSELINKLHIIEVLTAVCCASSATTALFPFPFPFHTVHEAIQNSVYRGFPSMYVVMAAF